MPEKKYGKWVVDKSLPEGGQAHTFVVYSEDDPEKKPFVLKRLKNKNRIDRFIAEAQAVMKLSHNNILQIVDFDPDADRPYLVAEYCVKGELSQKLLSNLSLLQRLRIFEQICDAVAYAHTQNIVHRDLKPENIFLRGDMTPVVGDFGISHIGGGGERFTLTEEAVGPFRYMAPELEDGRTDDIKPSADVYSLGKLLYWILSGRTFAREKHREDNFNLAKDKHGSEYHLINQFLDRMIIADPTKRLPTGKEVLQQLHQLIDRIDQRAHCVDINTPQPCLYCGLGFYKIVANNVPGIGKNVPGNVNVQNFGFTNYAGSQWLIMVCNYCGNVQVFRTDFIEPKNRNIWGTMR
jgi:serine/threonine protein kinase